MSGLVGRCWYNGHVASPIVSTKVSLPPRRVSPKVSQPDIMADARSYLSRKLGGYDFSSFADDVVRGCIESSYPGGWSDFESDFVASLQRAQSRAVSEALSPIKLKARVEYLIGRKLRLYDEIISADLGTDHAKIVVSFATVDYRSRRDIVTARTLTLFVFTRTESGWHRQIIDTETPEKSESVRFGAINTPERAEAIAEQVETCYRPGSDKSPMQGWVARAEMSWDQAHADEPFQAPSK